MHAAWKSTLGQFVAADPAAMLSHLHRFVYQASPEQEAAWRKSIAIIQREGRGVITAHPPADRHGTLWEYELPREGGRRPDILFLQDAAVLVVEFKNKGMVNLGDIDQVAAYARDLREYHSECRDIPVISILLYIGSAPRFQTEGVTVTTPNDFGKLVLELAHRYFCQPSKLDLDRWINGRYEPLPGIVQAARLLFDRQPLPFIRRAHSAGIPQSVNYVLSVCEEARRTRSRHLVMLTGVPGAGKTLVGLQVVHSDKLTAWLPDDKQHLNPASFLSGNGPLVAVLQDALKSRVFVRDMHQFIRQFAIKHQHTFPYERVIIFDEAQRAWTRNKVIDFYSKKGLKAAYSEPEMLIQIAQRMPEGCVVLALIGSGQEIHTGEEAGIQGWLDAVHGAEKTNEWTIHVPPAISRRFVLEGIPSQIADRLDLDVTLRSHAADTLHRWVSGLLDEPFMPEEELTATARSLQEASFPILLTRDLDWAREYARSRFEGETNRRFGLLASSKAKKLHNQFGIKNEWDPSFHPERWFNSSPDDAKSCCQLEKTAQEFHCQGLELDLPIVCWGEDFWWQDGWTMRPTRPNPLVKDPFTFRKNTYRVLLTRGREGLVIFVPPDDVLMEATAQKLIRCGAVPVEARFKHVESHVRRKPEPLLLPYEEVVKEAFKTALPLVAQLAAGPVSDGFFVSISEQFREVQWMRVDPSMCGPNRFIVRATGDSMEPGIQEGDHLVFEYHRTPRVNGQVVIINISEMPDAEAKSAIKRIWQKGQNWLITSDNPVYEPMALAIEQVKYPILGVLIGKREE